GKLSKMADGRLMTHAAGSEVNMDLLASMARDVGADETTVGAIRAANTARHVLELAAARGLGGLCSALCARVVGHLARHAASEMAIDAVLVDFDGKELGRHPPTPPASSTTEVP
ncbi:MAG TPA: hypothetical protein VJT73_10210, partial [Polyangiaceae bacterium]|nr:hypothetical protein [Polyangiaceae bacterium]